MKPFFSIIIPTLNEENYVPKLLTDLCLQTFTDFEVLVVDAKSEDQTKEVVRSFKKARLIVSSVRNISYQRNLGTKYARGQYLIFNDADIRLHHNFLNILYHQLSKNAPDVFATLSLPPDTKPSAKMMIVFINLILRAGILLRIPSASGTCIGCKKETFIKIGGFDLSIGFGEDSEFVRRAVKSGLKFNLFEDPRYIYSLRRFEKNGYSNTLLEYIKLNAEIILRGFPKKDQVQYPMGGSYYHPQNSKTKLSTP